MKTLILAILILVAATSQAQEDKKPNIVTLSSGLSQPSSKETVSAIQLNYLRKMGDVYAGVSVGTPTNITVSVGFGF